MQQVARLRMSGWLDLTPQGSLLVAASAPRARGGGAFPTSEQECALERGDAGDETRPAAPKSATDMGRQVR